MTASREARRRRPRCCRGLVARAAHGAAPIPLAQTNAYVAILVPCAQGWLPRAWGHDDNARPLSGRPSPARGRRILGLHLSRDEGARDPVIGHRASLRADAACGDTDGRHRRGTESANEGSGATSTLSI